METSIADMLNRAIAEQELRPAEAAARLDVSLDTLYSWRNGERTPTQPGHINSFIAFTGEDREDVLRAAGYLGDDEGGTLVGADPGLRDSSTSPLPEPVATDLAAA